MARCAYDDCGRWRPDALINYTGEGSRVDERWYCSPRCVESATRARLMAVHAPRKVVACVPPLRLGTLLMHQGTIDRDQLNSALTKQKRSKRRLGAQLIAMRLASPDTIMRALAAQSGGVSFLSAVEPSNVRSAPGGLSRDEVLALGVVPLHADPATRVMQVACAAPIPRAALAALVQLTRWTAVPYLVSDPDIAALRAAYGTGQSETRRRTQFTRVRDVADAAARIATTAASEREVTVTHTYWAPDTWVRIEGEQTIDTMIVGQSPTEELACQAATT